MGNIKRINVKIQTYNFSNDIINIEDVGYITIKKIGDYKITYGVNPLYLIIDKVDSHIKENNGNKYLAF